MVTTKRASEISLTVFVFGKSTSIPDCRIGAVIMKISYSTSTTPTYGTILISESVEPVSRESCGIGVSSTVKRLNTRDELHGEIIHPCSFGADALQIVVVSDDGRNRGEKSGRSSDQRFGNTRRDHAQARRPRCSQSFERVHHAQHRAEQPDERRDRSDGRKAGHPSFQPAHLFGRR